MKKTALALLLLLGCTSTDATVKHAVDAMGMHDVQPGGVAFFACGEGDWFRTEFKAKSASGEPVEGVVCCGLWAKACTVRIDQ